MSYAIEILTFILFFALLAKIIQRRSIFEAFFVIAALIFGTIGEMLNLFVYKATAYTDRAGVPIFIILGGALIAWSYLKLPQYLAARIEKLRSCSSLSDRFAKQSQYKKIKPTCGIKKNNLAMQIVLFLFLSILFPVIEIAGIKANLWYWLKPYSLTSPWWWIGVWKFYMLFLGIPVLIALSFLSVKNCLHKRLNVIH